MDEYLYRCTKGPIAAGFVVREGRVVKVAPILWRVKRLTKEAAISLLESQGYAVEQIQSDLPFDQGGVSAGPDNEGTPS